MSEMERVITMTRAMIIYLLGSHPRVQMTTTMIRKCRDQVTILDSGGEEQESAPRNSRTYLPMSLGFFMKRGSGHSMTEHDMPFTCFQLT